MAARILPGIGLTGYWELGSDGWNTGMDENLRKLSALCQLAVKSRTTALPASPTDGDIYIVPSSATSNGNAVAIRDNGTWVYLTPKSGLRAYQIDTGAVCSYNGTAWSDENSFPEAPVDGKTYGRKDAGWAEVTGGGGTATRAAVSCYLPGKPDADQVMLSYPFLFSGKLPASAIGSQAAALAAPGNETTLTLRRNDTAIGTIVFSANSKMGAFNVASDVIFAIGDILNIVAPSTPDTLFAGISVALKLNL